MQTLCGISLSLVKLFSLFSLFTVLTHIHFVAGSALTRVSEKYLRLDLQVAMTSQQQQLPLGLIPTSEFSSTASQHEGSPIFF
jgi:hypothetical protein